MESTQKKPARERKPQSGPAPQDPDAIEYVVTTAQGAGGVWKPFRTLAGARRGLEKARALYPDAFITTTRSRQADPSS